MLSGVFTSHVPPHWPVSSRTARGGVCPFVTYLLMLTSNVGMQEMFCAYLLNQYMVVVSPESSSVHVTPVTTVEEFTFSKYSSKNFFWGPGEPFCTVNHYLLASYAFWSGRFAGLNVEPSHLRQKYPQCVSSWYPLTF